MSRFVGFCVDDPAWPNNVVGNLLVEEGGGWLYVGGHISSGEGWSSPWSHAMSLAELTATSSSDPADHFPIYKHLARHDVPSGRGGWDEWSVGCICGFYDKGTPGRWFIPSKQSAERIYKNHLALCGVPDPDCVLSPTDETADETRAALDAWRNFEFD